MENQEAKNEALIGGSGLNAGLGIEPDLNSLMKDGYAATWGDKKKQCQEEGREAWRHGEYSLLDNPYYEDTWPNKWWRDEYEACDA